MTNKTDKNWGAQWGFTDKDYIEELGLDPNLEGRPEINNAIKKAVYNSMVRDYVKNGLEPAKAEKLAHRQLRKKK